MLNYRQLIYDLFNVKVFVFDRNRISSTHMELMIFLGLCNLLSFGILLSSRNYIISCIKLKVSLHNFDKKIIYNIKQVSHINIVKYRKLLPYLSFFDFITFTTFVKSRFFLIIWKSIITNFSMWFWRCKEIRDQVI